MGVFSRLVLLVNGDTEATSEVIDLIPNSALKKTSVMSHMLKMLIFLC